MLYSDSLLQVLEANLVSTTAISKHRQDSVQPQQPVGFLWVESSEITWTDNEALYQHF